MTNKILLLLMMLSLFVGFGCSSLIGAGNDDSQDISDDSNSDPNTDNPITTDNNPPPNLTFIADHTSADLFETIPAEYIQAAKTNFKIMYGHTSHGGQIITGMEWLADTYGSLYDWEYHFGYWDCDPEHWLCDHLPSGDLGGEWESRTREALDESWPHRNFVMWSWCGQVRDSSEEYIHTYLSEMDGLIQDYPTIPFVFMTGHRDGLGSTGSIHIRNNQIRQHVQDTGGILFDFADIESYDPDGNYHEGADDECLWCPTWCENHPEDCQNLPDDCAHSHGFNCVRKAKAFWWMMARLAGWDGQP